MKFVALFFLFFSASFIGLSQAPNIQWQKCYGGTGLDASFYTTVTNDGGVIIGGISSSNNGDVTGNHGEWDFWILKLNASGGLEWQKCIGGTSNDFCCKIIQATDGGYVAVGWTRSNNGDVFGNHGYDDYWVVKLNSTGNILWSQTLGGSGNEYGIAITETIEGGYIVSGQSISSDGDVGVNNGNYDCFIVKLKKSGEKEWTKVYGGSGIDVAQSIIQTSDGGYAIAGFSTSTNGFFSNNHGQSDWWILKLDAEGNFDWQKLYGGSKSDTALSICQTSDNGYILSGWTSSNDGNVTGNHGMTDAWVVKLNASGNLEWQKTYGGSGADLGYYGITPTNDGGYVFCASTTSNDGDVSNNHGGWDYWVVKIDKLGNMKWQKTLGGGLDDYAGCIAIMPDNGLLITGQTTSFNGDITNQHGDTDVWVVKLATETTLPVSLIGFSALPKPTYNIISWESQNEINLDLYILQKSTDGINFSDIHTLKAKNEKDNRYTLNDNFPEKQTFYRLKMINQSGIYKYSYVLRLETPGISRPKLYPTPASDLITLSYKTSDTKKMMIELTDIAGKKLLTKPVTTREGINTFPLDIHHLVNGIYFVSLFEKDSHKPFASLTFIKE